MILTSVDLPAPLSPIRPDHFAGLEVEIDVLQRLDGAEMLGDAAQLQKRHPLPPLTRHGPDPTGSSLFLRALWRDPLA